MSDTSVRIAGADDLLAVGQLLHDFNVEFDDPAPPPPVLAARLRDLTACGDTTVLVVGEPTLVGLSLLRFRPSLWSARPECYLAELYVVPPLRRHGLGRALLEASIAEARARGVDRIELGTSEGDVGARALYEKLGFTNREHPPDGPIMHVYELELEY